MKKIIFLFIFLLSGFSGFSQLDSSFFFTPSPYSATFYGQAQIDGLPADSNDYIGAFDSLGNCVGSVQLVVNNSISYINLVIYGDDPTTPNIDEGINNSENFFLKLFDYSESQIFDYPSFDSIYSFSGWQNNNGAPLPGYSSTDSIYNFITCHSFSQNYISTCDSVVWNNTTYFISGTYTWLGINAQGCDSVATLNLTINNSINPIDTVYACDSYTWNSSTYFTSGSYSWLGTNSFGCDSLVRIFLVINNSNSGVDSITSCDSYTWNSINYTLSGVYTNLLTNIYGCDSLATLYLNIIPSSTSTHDVFSCDSYLWNNTLFSYTGTYVWVGTNSVGCDSTAILTLTIFNSSSSTYNITSCDSYVWDGITYNSTGLYTNIYTDGNGCDSSVTLDLTINNSSSNIFNFSSCNSYLWDGIEYDSSGLYTNIYTGINGCDSSVTLNLTIINNSIDTSVTSCDSFIWDGISYDSSGIYTNLYSDINGCDSTVTLDLTINNSTSSTVTVTSCDSFDWDGVTYNSTGLYTNVYIGSNGCDSIVTLDLTINNSSSSTVTVTACDSFDWDGVTYTNTGLYTNLYSDINGCDSAVTLDLTINYSSSSTVTVTACDSFDWDGVTYTNTGLYTNLYTDFNGCDSTVTLDLTINNSSSSTVIVNACDSFDWDGVTYTTTGLYTNLYSDVNGCDSLVTLDLTINYSSSSIVTVTECDSYVWDGVTYDSTGFYTNVYTDINGCDSSVTLDLTINYSFSSTSNFYICNGQSVIIGSNVYTLPGTYVNVYSTYLGCDSTITTIIDTLPSSSCNFVTCPSYKPTGLYVNNIVDIKATINWDNMNDSACMVLKYYVRYRVVNPNGTYGNWITKSAGVGNGLCNFGLNTTSKILQNLTASTTYQFRMKAFYCGGTSSNYSPPVQFTTADVCPDMTNLTTTTFNGNQSKVRFNWDTTGVYTFARILLRVDVPGSNWQTAGGFGVYYPTLFVNKFGLTPGQSYRAQGRTFCDSNITAYRSPTWTAPIFWTQPGSIKLEGGTAINNLDVYPNPSRDVFNISFNSDKRQDLSIRILNVVGAEVYREDRQEFIGEYIKQISLDNYGKGIYFLEIETSTGVVNKKLILQ